MCRMATDMESSRPPLVNFQKASTVPWAVGALSFCGTLSIKNRHSRIAVVVGAALGGVGAVGG